MKLQFWLAWVPWLVSVNLMLSGTLLSLLHFRRRRIDRNLPAPPISIIKPLKGNQPGLRENLASFFHLEYPSFEIIFCFSDAQDPAVPIVRDLMARYDEVQASLLIQNTRVGANPKMNNIAASVQAARFDLILVSDSTIRVTPDYLHQMRPHLREQNGVITGIVSGSNARGIGGHLEALHLNTFCARGMLLAMAIGKPCVLGKSMLIRRSTLNRFGGIEVLAQYLAEDFITGQAMFHLGLKVATLHEPVHQHIGKYSFTEFWMRHVRWGRMRKCHAPAIFATELLWSATLASSLGAWILTQSFGGFFIGGFWGAFLFHALLWLSLDLFTIKSLRGRFGGVTILAWIMREMLLLPLWFDVLRDNKILWKGHRLRLQPGGLVESYP